MPNQLTETGLQIKSNAEILSDLTTAMQTIYGSDINLDSNSPDGQLINIVGQAANDMLELLLAVYNSFSVSNATGVYLDQRVALNGLIRKSGTYSRSNVSIVTSKAVTLTGLDALTSNPNAVVFTVADGSGNKFYLETTTAIGGATTTVASFRAADLGKVEIALNTISNQVTVVSGVTSVNNPAVALAIGVDEETDMQLRIRHAKSFFLGAIGPADSIEAALLALPDVTDAFVAENNTASPAGGVAAHSIWCIVEGGLVDAIANAIYMKKAPGCGMTGSQTQAVTRPNGTTFTAKYDRPVTSRLYVKFTCASKVPGLSFDFDYFAAQLASLLIYHLNDSPSTSDVIMAMATIEPRALLTVIGVSTDGSSWSDTVSPSDYQHKFTLAAADITITAP